MNKEEKIQWLEERKTYIGGSDIGAILGVNSYRSALDVFLSKTTDVADSAISQAAHWGNRLEEIIADEYCCVSGNKAIKPSGLIRHPKFNHIAANIDRWIEAKDGTRYVLECKTTNLMKSHEWGEEGTDEIPLNYLYQVAYYSAICESDRVDIAVLIGGQDFRIYTYRKNEELEEKLIRAANTFWNNYVLPRVAPAARTNNDVSTLYSQSNGEALEADEKIVQEIEELKSIKQKEKELMKAKLDKEMKIKACMGLNEAIISRDGALLVTWKNGKARQFLDTDRLKAEKEDIYQQYLNIKETGRMFLVK